MGRIFVAYVDIVAVIKYEAENNTGRIAKII